MQMQDIMLIQPLKHHKQNVQQELTKHLLDNPLAWMQMQDIMLILMHQSLKLNAQ